LYLDSTGTGDLTINVLAELNHLQHQTLFTNFLRCEKCRIEEFETEELKNEIVENDELIVSYSIGITELDNL
ncbi:15644_t:CDS:2, partial [Racocetra fulgida]